MSLNNFTLVMDWRTDHNRVLNDLFEAGCDDATVSFDASAGEVRIEFDREADDLVRAVVSAILDVESVGFLVRRIGGEEWVYQAEIAARLGLTREYVRLLVNGTRGPGGFPAPVAPKAHRPMWRWDDIERWYAGWKGLDAVFDDRRRRTFEYMNSQLVRRNLALEFPELLELESITARLEKSASQTATPVVEATGPDLVSIDKTAMEAADLTGHR